MGFLEEKFSGSEYITVTTSAASTSNPVTGNGILKSVIVNTAPTSAILIYDGEDEDGTLLTTIAAATAVGTHYDYDIRYTGGIAVSAQSSNTDIVVSYIGDQV